MSDAIVAKIVLRLTFETTAPLLIGGGRDDSSDLSIIRLSDGSPFIPGSSIAGRLLRCFLDNQATIKQDDLDFMKFWGIDISNDERHQSHLNVGPALLTDTHKPKTTIYDGVRIDPASGTAADQGKYNYEYLDTGAMFKQEFVVTVRENADLKNMEKLAHFILTCYQKGLSFGAKAKLGFGEVKLDTYKFVKFIFPKDFGLWMDYCTEDKLPDKHLIISDPIPYVATEKFQLKIDAELGGPIITALKEDKKDSSDKIQYHREGQHLIPASSLMGPLTHRARKILNTVRPTEAKGIHETLFGTVDEKNKKTCKSRIMIRETRIENVIDHPQTRTKIDRFTGGVIPGALTQTQPVTPSDSGPHLTLDLEITQPSPHEITLLMMVAKDLLTGDLAIGGEKGIGRGVLMGGKVEAILNEKTAAFTVTRDGTISGSAGFLAEDYDTFVWPEPKSQEEE